MTARILWKESHVIVNLKLRLAYCINIYSLLWAVNYIKQAHRSRRLSRHVAIRSVPARKTLALENENHYLTAWDTPTSLRPFDVNAGKITKLINREEKTSRRLAEKTSCWQVDLE